MNEYNHLKASLSLIDTQIKKLIVESNIAKHEFWFHNGPNLINAQADKLVKLRRLKSNQKRELGLAKHRMLTGRVKKWKGRSFLHQLNNYPHILKLIGTYLPDELVVLRLIAKDINPAIWSHQFKRFSIITSFNFLLLPPHTRDEGYPSANGTMCKSQNCMGYSTEHERELIVQMLHGRRSMFRHCWWNHEFVVSGGKLSLLQNDACRFCN